MASNILSKLNSSIIPDFPRHSHAVDNNGHFTPLWHLSLSNLYQALQRNLSNEGWSIPRITQSDKDLIQSIYTQLIGKSLQDTNPATPNISGNMAYLTSSTPPGPIMFIIEFTVPDDPTSIITSAAWKTFTLT